MANSISVVQASIQEDVRHQLSTGTMLCRAQKPLHAIAMSERRIEETDSGEQFTAHQ